MSPDLAAIYDDHVWDVYGFIAYRIVMVLVWAVRWNRPPRNRSSPASSHERTRRDLAEAQHSVVVEHLHAGGKTLRSFSGCLPRGAPA